MAESPDQKRVEPSPTTVFFSYSRTDEKAARPIIEALEGAGFSVWWDGLLAGGERFAQTTATALDSAQAVVVLWSKTSIDSHWVHDEATLGRDRGRLVPLSLDGSVPPLGFRQFQVLDAARGRRPGSLEMQRVIEAVAALHQGSSTTRLTPRPARQPPSRRALIVAGAGAVSAAGAGAAWWALGPGRSGPPDNTVAVLPFTNMSGDPAQAYFADGLAAEVRAALARNAVLRVMGQTSSNAFSTRSDDARTIARKLGVAYLLDGNVRRAGDRVRVAAELIEGRTGFSRWSKTFDRALDDVFAVQSEIAEAVTAALSRQVSGAASGDLSRATGTQSVAAYDAYLRGRADYALGAGGETDRSALAHFDDAVAIDPAFAAAHAGRSSALVAIANQGAGDGGRRALYDQAIAAATQAATLEPNSATAQSALGFAIANGRLNLRAARPAYDRSSTLGRGDPDVLSRFAVFCGNTGRFTEAEAAIQRAIQLDPLNPGTFRSSAYIRYAARLYADVAEPSRRALALAPTMGTVHAYEGYAQLMLGRLDAAQAAFDLEPSALPRLPGLAIVARRRGDTAASRQAFDALVAKFGDNGLYQQAQVLAQWGDLNGALAALQRARATGDAGLKLAGQDPLLDPLRKMPELSRLLRDLGFD